MDSNITHAIQEAIRLEPDHIVLDLKEEEPTCNLRIFNSSESSIALKMKTTHPQRYHVKPDVEIIQPGTSINIKIALQRKDAEKLRKEVSIIKKLDNEYQSNNRFMVQCTLVGSAHLPTVMENLKSGIKRDLVHTLKEIFHEATADSLYSKQIRCIFVYTENSTNGYATNNVPSSASNRITRDEIDSVVSKSSRGKKNNDGTPDIYTKYNDLLNFTVKLTAERDQCKSNLKSLNSELGLLKKGNTMRVMDVCALDEQEIKPSESFRLNTLAKTSIPLWPVFIVAVIAFVLGHIVQ